MKAFARNKHSSLFSHNVIDKEKIFYNLDTRISFILAWLSSCQQDITCTLFKHFVSPSTRSRVGTLDFRIISLAFNPCASGAKTGGIILSLSWCPDSKPWFLGLQFLRSTTVLPGTNKNSRTFFLFLYPGACTIKLLHEWSSFQGSTLG